MRVKIYLTSGCWEHGMWNSTFLLLTATLLLLFSPQNEVMGHGRLIEPPSRSSMWRYGFNTTANYNDHELYCGGFSRQYQKNGGNCGVCGDAYDMPQPRPNEAGGVYGQGIVVRKYRLNSIIRIKVELTANHKGYFEFRLCPNNNPKKVVSQKCLDNYLLKQSNGEGPRYFPGEGTKVFESRFILPKDLTCTQCVMQWRYIAGNNWGPCQNGSQGVGCGPQEEFRACADVSITDRSGHASSEESEDIDDNDVDTNKLEGDGTETTSETPYGAESEHVVWPFIMALVALIVAAIVFGALFGWFYRKEVLEFTRAKFNKVNWKMRNGSQFLPATQTMNNYAQNTTEVGHRPPIPPPRNKKTSTSDLQLGCEEYHNQQNQRRIITPDVISQPMSVTLNGFPI